MNTFNMGSNVLDQQLGCLWQKDHLLTLSLSGYINYLDKNNPDKPLRIIKVCWIPCLLMVSPGAAAFFGSNECGCKEQFAVVWFSSVASIVSRAKGQTHFWFASYFRTVVATLRICFGRVGYVMNYLNITCKYLRERIVNQNRKKIT